MNRILWIFICVLLIIVLFAVTAYSSVTYENMTPMEAKDGAIEYAQNLKDEAKILTDRITQIDALIEKTQLELDKTNNDLKKLDPTTDEYDKRSKEFNLEIEQYQRRIELYKSAKTRSNDSLTDLYINIIDADAKVDYFSKLVTNDPDTPADTVGEDTTAANTQLAEPEGGVAFVPGPGDQMVALEPTGDLGGSPTYYAPGTYRFGSSTYVPSYEDSIYLSKTTGKSSVSSYLNEASIKGGSCSYYENQPDKLEEMCMAVDKNNCGAMSCCVLLGGSKCVSGNKLGPLNKLNYGDITVRDKDYYYYQGKCYGNCQ
jgi:hypothetical protein